MQFNLFSQKKLYYHDTFRGGVSGGSYNPTWNTANPGTIDINIESGSTIRRAFLFIGVYGVPTTYTMEINDYEIVLNPESISSLPFSFQLTNSYSLKTAVIDITSFISTNEISVTPPINQPFATVGGRWVQFYVLVMYDNPNMPETSVAAFLNETNCTGIMSYDINDINPVDLNQDVSLIVNSEHLCNNEWDGSEIYIDNTYIGVIGGIDVNSNIICAGVSGAFYYQNNSLFGLGDDISNNSVDGPDAIANIQEYINFNNAFNLNFSYQSLDAPLTPTAPNSNVIWQFFMVYTSTCENIEFSLLTSDTTTCPNTPLQLGAFGGIAYNWLPETNLSCYDCPNPVFLGDSTINYTVRIWSTDSCSVVQPVRVRVLPQLTLEVVNNNPATCGFANGSLTALASGTTPTNTYTYTLSGGTQGLPGNFTNLAPGTYTLSATDANGCTSDTTVQILEINNVQAAFSVNPSTGAAPLQVQTQNNSQNATLYDWFWVDENSTLTNPSILLDTAGVYTLTLVAGNGAAHCNDTTTLQIIVYDSLQIVIPNVFTPNNDGVNDFFGITSNVSVSGSIIIVNRWGNVVFERNFATQAPVFEPLWNGNGATDGVYFYKIFIEEEGLEFLGNVSLWR